MNRNKKKAIVFLAIPIILSLLVCASFVAGVILEGPTNRGGAYTIFVLFSLLGAILGPIPCAVCTVLGLRSALWGKREGDGGNGLIILGILEILSELLLASLVLWLIFVGGTGV